MSKLTIDNFLGGIAPSDRMGAEGSYYQGRSVMPIHPLYFGYLCPGGTPIDISSSVSTSYAMEIDNANKRTYIGDITNKKLHQYNILNNNLTFGTQWPRSLSSTLSNHGGHEAGTPYDLKIYPVGSTNYLFYSWGDSTDGDVGRVELSGSPAFQDNHISNYASGGAVLTGNYTTPRPMLEWGESGMLYIGNQRDVHQFDGQTGTNGTFTAARLRLPFGWWITGLFDAGEYIGIVAHYYAGTTWSWVQYKGKAAVFFWDGSSPIFNKKVDIVDPEVRNAISRNGEIYLMCRDTMGRGNIRKWNGQAFVFEKEITCNVAAGTGVNKYSRYVVDRGVKLWGDQMMFGSTGGHGEIFTYGSSLSGLEEGLCQISNLNLATTASGNTEIYGLSVLSDKAIFSYYDPVSVSYKLAYLSFSATNNPKFSYKSLYYEFPQSVRINYVKLYFQPIESGQGDDISMTIDYGKETIHLGNLSYNGDGAITTKRFSGKNTQCDNLRIEIAKDEGAGIKYGKIIVDYDFIDEPK